MHGPQIEGLTRDNLIRLYVVDDAATMESVAEQLGCHRQTVLRWLHRYELPTKPRAREGPRNERTERLADRKWLKAQMAARSVVEIAQELGVNDVTVYYWIQKHNLPTQHNRSEEVAAGLQKKYPKGRFGKEAGNWRGGRRELPSGYVYIYAPDHPYKTKTNTVMEHRLIMEKHLGRYLKPDEVVHHLNGDKSDNRLENLKVMKRGHHMKRHFQASHEVLAMRERIAELEAENLRLCAYIAELESWLNSIRETWDNDADAAYDDL